MGCLPMQVVVQYRLAFHLILVLIGRWFVALASNNLESNQLDNQDTHLESFKKIHGGLNDLSATIGSASLSKLTAICSFLKQKPAIKENMQISHLLFGRAKELNSCELLTDILNYFPIKFEKNNYKSLLRFAMESGAQDCIQSLVAYDSSNYVPKLWALEVAIEMKNIEFYEKIVKLGACLYYLDESFEQDNLKFLTQVANTCPVCLEVVKIGVICGPKNHLMHERCLGQWVQKNSNCPICRDLIPPSKEYLYDLLLQVQRNSLAIHLKNSFFFLAKLMPKNEFYNFVDDLLQHALQHVSVKLLIEVLDLIEDINVISTRLLPIVTSKCLHSSTKVESNNGVQVLNYMISRGANIDNFKIYALAAAFLHNNEYLAKFLHDLKLQEYPNLIDQNSMTKFVGLNVGCPKCRNILEAWCKFFVDLFQNVHRDPQLVEKREYFELIVELIPQDFLVKTVSTLLATSPCPLPIDLLIQLLELIKDVGLNNNILFRSAVWGSLYNQLNVETDSDMHLLEYLLEHGANDNSPYPFALAASLFFNNPTFISFFRDRRPIDSRVGQDSLAKAKQEIVNRALAVDDLRLYHLFMANGLDMNEIVRIKSDTSAAEEIFVSPKEAALALGRRNGILACIQANLYDPDSLGRIIGVTIEANDGKLAAAALKAKGFALRYTWNFLQTLYAITKGSFDVLIVFLERGILEAEELSIYLSDQPCPDYVASSLAQHNITCLPYSKISAPEILGEYLEITVETCLNDSICLQVGALNTFLDLHLLLIAKGMIIPANMELISLASWNQNNGQNNFESKLAEAGVTRGSLLVMRKRFGWRPAIYTE